MWTQGTTREFLPLTLFSASCRCVWSLVSHHRQTKQGTNSNSVEIRHQRTWHANKPWHEGIQWRRDMNQKANEQTTWLRTCNKTIFSFTSISFDSSFESSIYTGWTKWTLEMHGMCVAMEHAKFELAHREWGEGNQIVPRKWSRIRSVWLAIIATQCKVPWHEIETNGYENLFYWRKK